MLLLTDKTALLVIDVQEKLLPVIADNDRLLLNVLKCLKGARLLGLPLLYTEQYPKALGPTVARLRDELRDAPLYEKTAFSCCHENLLAFLNPENVKRLLIVGLEAHICVFQTARELVEKGFEVIVAADAVSSRQAVDAQWALRNMEKMGVTVSTFECLFMAYLKDAKHPHFKAMSAILKL